MTVRRPDGTYFEAEAQFNLSHFNISDPEIPIDRRWRVTIAIINKTKDDVPVGSKLLVAEEVASKLVKREA